MKAAVALSDVVSDSGFSMRFSPVVRVCIGALLAMGSEVVDAVECL